MKHLGEEMLINPCILKLINKHQNYTDKKDENQKVKDHDL